LRSPTLGFSCRLALDCPQMDPAACLEILARNAAQCQVVGADGNLVSCCAAGCPVPSFGGGNALVNALAGDEAAGVDAESAPPLPPRGQVIDLETGENELSTQSLLELFPALRPGFDAASEPSSEAVPMEAETEAGAAARPQGDVGAEHVAMEETPTDAESAPITAEEADRRVVERLAASLRGSAPADLVKEVVRLHEKRVLVHKAYDGAFNHLLNAPGGGAEAIARMYPFVVGCATARFTVLSRSVRAVAAVLEETAASAAGPTEAAELVRKLQGMEKDRLQLVAAYHLEQSRLWALGRVKENSSESQTARMARRTCTDLRRRLGSADEEIEETISELKYCAADLRQDADM